MGSDIRLLGAASYGHFDPRGRSTTVKPRAGFEPPFQADGRTIILARGPQSNLQPSSLGLERIVNNAHAAVTVISDEARHRFKQALEAPRGDDDSRGPRNEAGKRPPRMSPDADQSEETQRRPHRRLEGDHRGHPMAAPFPGQASVSDSRQFTGFPSERSSNVDLETGAQEDVTPQARTRSDEHLLGSVDLIGEKNDLKGTQQSFDWLGMYANLKEFRKQQLLTAAQSTLEFAAPRPQDTESSRYPTKNKGVGLEKTVTFVSKTARDASTAAQLNARANIEQGVVTNKLDANFPSVNASGGGYFSVNILA